MVFAGAIRAAAPPSPETSLPGNRIVDNETAIAAAEWLLRAVTNTVLFLAATWAFWKVVVEKYFDRMGERLRSELERERFEHQTRFGTIYNRQANIIANIYARLEQAHLAFQRLVFEGRGPDKAHLKEAEQAYRELTEYYWKRAIWLDAATCNAMNEILAKFHSLHLDLTINVDAAGNPLDKATGKAVVKEVNEEIPRARTILQERFRRLLGIPEE